MYKSVTLQCSAININKTLSSLTYQWQKDTNDIKGACSNTYQTNEPGVYRCKISNKYTTVYTQDAVLALEPVWVTDIIIDTTEIINTGKILYNVLPENAINKTITFDTKITPEYSIDSSGNVVINVDNCTFEVIARSQFGKDYSEVIGKGTITGYVIIPLQSIQITTTVIEDAGQIETIITPENASIIRKEFELLSGSQYVVMNNTGYVSEVKSPGTISVRVSGFDKSGNVIADEKYITLKNKYVKVTNVEITTDTIHNNGYIQYETTPPSTLSDLKSIKIELDNEDNPEYVEVDINENGEVTNITEDKDGKKFKAKITVVDKYNNIVTNTKEITCKFTILVKSITVPTQEITDEGFITYTVLPENATNKNVRFEFTTPPPGTTQELGDAEINNTTGKISVINEGFNYVVVIAQDGSGVKGEGTIILKKTPVIPTGDYFIANTARGNKTGRGSWDNATDDIKTFYTNSAINLGKTYIETDKICTCNINGVLNVGGTIIGGCEVGKFVSKSITDKSSICNIDGGNNDGVNMQYTTSLSIINCNFYNISGDHGIDIEYASSITLNNCDFYDIGGKVEGISMDNTSSIMITGCNFYNISGIDYEGVSMDDNTISLSANNCNFHNISGDWGISVRCMSATIQNCIFSALESPNPEHYTSYSALIKILPPETGCKFLPKDRAQSIVFSDDSIINGKKVSDLLNTYPTITITPDNITDSGTIAYTITPETNCQFAIINGTFDAVTIGTTENVNIDNNMMWFVGAKTINIASVKYDSNLVVRVSCMDGSGYYVDKTIPVKSTKIQSLTIDLPDGGVTIPEFIKQYTDIDTSIYNKSQSYTYKIPITVVPDRFKQYVKFNTLSFKFDTSNGRLGATDDIAIHYHFDLKEDGDLYVTYIKRYGKNASAVLDGDYINKLTDDIKVTAYTTDGSNLSITSTLFKKDT